MDKIIQIPIVQEDNTITYEETQIFIPDTDFPEIISLEETEVYG